MTRAQRRWHLVIWSVLLPVLLLVIVLAASARPTAVAEPASGAETGR